MTESLSPGTEREFAGIVFCWIPPGSFMMGSPEDEEGRWRDCEGPQHEVIIAKGFWMSKYPITQAQWQAIMGHNPSWFKGENPPLFQRYVKSVQQCHNPSYFIGYNRPVEHVSWDDIRETDGFLDKINALNPEYNFHLPSEAEWEYAYRAGTTTRYYWGDDPYYTAIGDFAWYSANSGTDNGRKTHDVGQKLPNAWGLYDMAGNVWEWCEDDWHWDYHGAPRNGSAWVENPRGSWRLLRGGSWAFTPIYCRAAHRCLSGPYNRDLVFSFRLVCDV